MDGSLKLMQKNLNITRLMSVNLPAHAANQSKTMRQTINSLSFAEMEPFGSQEIKGSGLHYLSYFWAAALGVAYAAYVHG